MTATVDISHRVWPLSMFERWRGVEPYGKSLGAVLGTAQRYADAMAEEVAVATGRSPGRGRALTAAGHVLGWGGLALTLLGIFTLQDADLKQLLFGPFGIGLLMQLPSGALVRAGRRELRPTEEEQSAVDKRRPVVLLRSTQSDDDVDFLNDELRPAFLRFGPLVDSSRMVEEGTKYGTADLIGVLTRHMEQSVILVLAPSYKGDDADEIGWVADICARRKLGTKLLVLMPTIKEANGEKQSELQRQQVWSQLRAKMITVPGFGGLPEAAPARLIALHLDANGALVLVTGSKRANADEYERAVDAAIYGMKCHGRW